MILGHTRATCTLKKNFYNYILYGNINLGCYKTSAIFIGLKIVHNFLGIRKIEI